MPVSKQGKDLEQYVSVVVLDEVGLAEDSPKMPLKALHPLLEDGCIEDDPASQKSWLHRHFQLGPGSRQDEPVYLCHVAAPTKESSLRVPRESVLQSALSKKNPRILHILLPKPTKQCVRGRTRNSLGFA